MTRGWEKKEEPGFFEGLGGKAHKSGKGVIALKVLPSTFLVILGILTHVRFLHVFVSEYLIYCCLVWTLRATNCSIEIGRSFVCPILILILILLCVIDVF